MSRVVAVDNQCEPRLFGLIKLVIPCVKCNDSRLQIKLLLLQVTRKIGENVVARRFEGRAAKQIALGDGLLLDEGALQDVVAGLSLAWGCGETPSVQGSADVAQHILATAKHDSVFFRVKV